MQALVQYFLDRGIFVNLLTSLLILMGGYIALTMNREAFPNIDFDIVVITTIYPGASPEEVEKLVTNPIEETIKEVDGIEEYKSVSITNRSQITMKIDPDVDDTAKVVDDIRSAVGRAEDLPEDSEEPIIVEVSTARQPVVEWALERVPDADGNYQVSYAELREFARRMENEFLQMDSVARVERKGWRDAEIFVDVNPDKLRRYNVSTGTIVQALAVRNVNFPGGDIELGKNEITVRTVEEFESETEIARLPLRSNDIGQSVTIGDVARVYEHFEKPEYLEYTMGNPSISLTVVKRESADIISVVEDSKHLVMRLAPYFLAVDVEAPGLSAARIQQQITDPISAYLRDNAPFIKREIPVEISDGRAHMQIVLNPDYSFSFFHSQWIQMTTDYNPENIEDQLDYSHEQLLELLEDAKAELKTGDRIHSMSTEFTRRPAGIAIHDINDVSFFVKRRLRVLGSNGIMGLILVIASLFFFMGWRTSTMVAAGIPVALGISFVVMNFLGVTLNLISMFGLIMVIGIIVDDAIIVSENFYRYLEEGLPTLEAAARGTAEVIPPVVATISTSVAAFGPMMFMSGIFGKFVYTIPLVVIIALLASLFECFFILPSHLYEMNELGGVKADIKEGGNWFTFLRDQLYMPALEFGLRHRWVGVGGLVAMFIATLLIFGAFGEFKLFPSAIETLHVKITLPSGRTKEQTSRYIHAIEHHLNQLSDDELKNYTARAGITQKPGGNDPFTRRGSNYGQLVVFLTSELDRPDVPTELIATRLRSQTEWLLDDAAYINKKERDLALIERMEEKGGDEADAIRSVYMNESTDALRDEWRRLRELREEEAQYSSAALENASNGTRDSEAVNQPVADSTTEDGFFASISNWFNGDEEERTLAEISAEKRRLREQFNRDLLALRDQIDYNIPPAFANLEGGLEGLEIEMLEGGPPVGKAVAIEITGDNFQVMEQIAAEYKEQLERIAGVVDIDDDFIEGKDELRLNIDEGLSSQAGVTVVQIAQAVNAAFEGVEATSIRRPEEEVEIRVRFAEEFRNDLNSLNKIYVTNPLGNFIPVSRMANWQEDKGIVAINHLDGRRLVTVTANVDGITSEEAVSQARELTAHIPEKYPGYQIRFGGENKDTEESMASLGRAFLVGVIIIFMILASLFRSLVQPFVILIAVPFSMIGVLLAFLLHGEPLSFLSMMGIIGLSGIVINDSIVLVDFANRIRAENPEMSNHDVIVKAAAMRLRAVMLTSITTVLGLLPTAYGIGGYDPFLVPMALSFAWGLIFSTVLILGLVPILYLTVEEIKTKRRMKKLAAQSE